MVLASFLVVSSFGCEAWNHQAHHAYIAWKLYHKVCATILKCVNVAADKVHLTPLTGGREYNVKRIIAHMKQNSPKNLAFKIEH